MDEKFKVLSASFLVAFSSLIWELSMAQMMGTLLGQSPWAYGTVGALYILGLGLGSVLIIRSSLFFWEGFLTLVGSLVPVLIFGGDIFWRELFQEQQSWCLYLWVYSIILLMSTINGMEIPLLIKWGEKYSIPSRKILALDYLGSCMGCILFPLFFYPKMGLWGSCQWASLSSGVVFCWAPSSTPLRTRLWLLALPLGLLFYQETMANFLVKLWLKL